MHEIIQGILTPYNEGLQWMQGKRLQIFLGFIIKILKSITQKQPLEF